MQNVNFRMTASLLEDVDDRVEESEFTNRSDYIRSLIRDDLEGDR